MLDAPDGRGLARSYARLLDREVFGEPDDDAAVAHAQALGAVLADHQPQDDVRVMLDPAGHPFCPHLDTDG